MTSNGSIITEYFSLNKTDHNGSLARFHLKDLAVDIQANEHEVQTRFIQAMLILAFEFGSDFNDCGNVSMVIGNQIDGVEFYCEQGQLISTIIDIFEIVFQDFLHDHTNYISFKQCDCYACST